MHAVVVLSSARPTFLVLLLPCRVSDQMLNLWLLLMFGTGMPLLYAIGVVWLIVIELVDRHALARLCKQPVRYGPRLPYLLLGEFVSLPAFR